MDIPPRLIGQPVGVESASELRLRGELVIHSRDSVGPFALAGSSSNPAASI